MTALVPILWTLLTIYAANQAIKRTYNSKLTGFRRAARCFISVVFVLAILSVIVGTGAALLVYGISFVTPDFDLGTTVRGIAIMSVYGIFSGALVGGMSSLAAFADEAEARATATVSLLASGLLVALAFPFLSQP